MADALPGVAADGPAGIVLTPERLKLWGDITTRYSLDAASAALLRNG